jgi:hypothetical protein
MEERERCYSFILFQKPHEMKKKEWNGMENRREWKKKICSAPT